MADTVQQNPPNAAANPEGEEAQQQGGGWPSIWKMLLAYFVVTQIIGLFTQNKALKKEDLIDKAGNQVILTDKIQNLFYDGHEFNITGYISPQTYFTLDKASRKAVVNEKRKHVFSASGLKYNFDESNFLDFNITFPVSEKFIEKNATMYLHLDIAADYRFKYDHLDTQMPDIHTGKQFSDAWFKDEGNTIVMHRSIPLVKYLPKVAKKKTVNLLDGTVIEEEIKEEVKVDEDEGVLEDEIKPQEFVQHLLPEIYCYMTPDTTVYSKKSIPEQLKNIFKINTQLNFYEPMVTCTDFWAYRDIMVELNKTVTQANVTVHFQPYSLTKVAMIEQFDVTNKVYAEWGMSSDMDLTKKMLSETNFYLLVLTIFVSLAHTICEMLAFKNEIHFWKERDSVKGISVRTLFIKLGMSVIIFLYLLDREETSLMISIPAGLGIAIECWKITKAMKVTSKPTFPYISIEDKESYMEEDTDKYDRVAMRYLSYAMYPLLAIYVVYSLFYEEHKGWYSFVINTLVGAVYVFGFITMTPQLYINYKLKSVEHLPWRALIYRFLNTIIDDLFSFIISMPTMHRISCFRDDVIFLIYLYQRWVYRVDKNRDPYGSLSKEEREAKEIDNLDDDSKYTDQPHKDDAAEDHAHNEEQSNEAEGIVPKKEDNDQVRKRTKAKNS